MALKITITDAGRAALINANKSGTRSVSIVSVGISGTSITADKSASSLPDEIKRISTISGKVTALDAIHLTAKDDGSDVYTIRSFALYLDDGTLFAIYGQSSPILEKSAAAMLLLQLDIRFADIDAAQLQFGNLDFINPAATEKTAGVTRLTGLGEAEQSVENIAVSPVELRRYAEKLARQADMIAALATKFDKTGGQINGPISATGAITAGQMMSAVWLLRLISGNGQNALDMHSDDDGIVRMYGKKANGDYQQFLAFNPQGNLDFNSPTGACLINGQLIWNRNNDGAGSGLDADFWRGLSPEHFATSDERNNLQDQINNRIISDYGRLTGGQRGFSAYALNNLLNFCCRDDAGNDHWYRFRTSEDTQAALDTKFDKTGGQVNGAISATGAITAGQMMSAVWLLRLISGNGQNALDMHSDDDGIVRMYGKKANGDYQQFLAFNPQGNLDFNSPTGACLINGQLIWNRNNDGAGSGLDADFWRGMSPDHFAANSRIETSGVSNGLMKRIDDHVELHLKLDNVVGVISLPHTFNNIVDIQITTFRDTDSRPVWANVISYTNNTITVSGNYMAHGNNQNAASCAGFIHVYGN